MSNVVTALQSAAGTILSVLAPATSRIARVAVRFRDDADTASTDGNVIIRMPRAFAGRPIPDDAAITLGLLAHELGHWVQPLDAVTEIARSRGAPHWLVNIALDIHGESFVQAVFPALRRPLQASRQAVHDSRLSGYLNDLDRANDFPVAALNACLIARFHTPAQAWDAHWADAHPVPPQVYALLQRLQFFQARHAAPADLPQLLASLLDDFPELTEKRSKEQGTGNKGNGSGRQESGADGASSASGAAQPAQGAGSGDAPDDGIPPYPDSDADDLGRILRQEMQTAARRYTPQHDDTLRTFSLKPSPPSIQARRLARTLQPRFQSRRGAIEVAAPGRLDRLDLARGAPIPLRMTLPGHESPAPQLILAIDLSSSMFIGRGERARQARIAAQALALAVKAAGGQVVVILFNTYGYVAPEEDDSLAFLTFSEMHGFFRGGTSFRFLDRAWRRWPDHQVLLLTDGDGSMPHPLPRDRERTAALLIDSDLDVSPMAARAVPLAGLDKLASVFALLIPDRRFAQ